MFVYISEHLTKRLSRDLQDYNETIQSLKTRISQLKNPLDFSFHSGFWSVGNGLYLYRSSHKTNRLIAGYRHINQEHVVIFYDVLSHLDKTYESFYQNVEEEAVRIKGLVQESSLTRWLNAQPTLATPLLESLPPSFQAWLHMNLSLNHQFVQGQDMIYESHSWATSIPKLFNQGHTAQLHRWVTDAWLSLPSTQEQIAHQEALRFEKNESCWMAYQILHLPEQKRSALCLIDAGQGDCPPHADRTFVHFHADMLKDLDQIARYCRRVYSIKQLEKKENWEELERIEEYSLDPCLPLSKEEIDVLQGLETEQIFPLFVDGPAGSGKSTLLSYYIAALIHYSRSVSMSADQIQNGLPLFVTYNERLQTETRKRVILHLRFHFGWQDEDSQVTASEQFFTLRQLFRTLLLDEQEPQFRSEKHVGFSKFRDDFWKEHGSSFLGKKSCSPEMAWFVIRSFIKGYATADQKQIQYFTSEEFLCLPTARQDGLLIDDFKTVENRVWPEYQNWLHKHGYWDDQDLCLAILSSRKLSEYTHKSELWMAIVCDEAQDLTCNDLRLLFRLLGLTRYNISSYSRPLIPFVFAADPMQTVNPSGFRWESFTSLFYEETGLLFGSPDKAVAKKQQSLQWNYRSHQDIVKISTAIQQWRNKNLNGWRYTETVPWNQEQGLIGRYILPDNGTEHIERLKPIFQKSVIVVPCQEDQSDQYAQNDNFLCQVLDHSFGQVFSPLTIKGLEFSQVILYGFARQLTQLWKFNERTQQGSLLRSEKELDFMLNALYVAATRARVALYFVDTREEDKLFWGPGFLGSLKMTSQIPPIVTAEEWTTRKNWTDEDEILNNAKQLLEQGISEQSSSLCYKAMQLFRHLQKTSEASIARAWEQFFKSPHSPDVVWQFYEQNILHVFEKYCWDQARWKGFYLLEQEGFSATTPFGRLGRYLGLFSEDPTISENHIAPIASSIHDGFDQQRQKPDPLLKQFYQTFLQTISKQIGSETTQSKLNLSQEQWRNILTACQILRNNAPREANTACMWISAVLGEHNKTMDYYRSVFKTERSSELRQKTALFLMRWLYQLDWLPADVFLEKTYNPLTDEETLSGILAPENCMVTLSALYHEDIVPYTVKNLHALNMSSPLIANLSAKALEHSMTTHLQHINSCLAIFSDLNTTETQAIFVSPDESLISVSLQDFT